MKIILLTDVKNLGKKGDIVNVSDGMAMNSLFPQKKAVPATHDNVQKRSSEVHNKESHNAALMNTAQRIFASIPNPLILTKNVNEKGNLFESIDAQSIMREIEKHLGEKIPSHIKVAPMSQPIKTIGEYPYTVIAHDSQTRKDVKRDYVVSINK
jgi:large subunit ribosomal protein L9